MNTQVNNHAVGDEIFLAELNCKLLVFLKTKFVLQGDVKAYLIIIPRFKSF